MSELAVYELNFSTYLSTGSADKNKINQELLRRM